MLAQSEHLPPDPSPGSRDSSPHWKVITTAELEQGTVLPDLRQNKTKETMGYQLTWCHAQKALDLHYICQGYFSLFKLHLRTQKFLMVKILIWKVSGDLHWKNIYEGLLWAEDDTSFQQ